MRAFPRSELSDDLGSRLERCHRPLPGDAGAYGIRIENLVLVEPGDGAEREMLGFETPTLAPIHRNLIERSLLDDNEIAWLDAYHARVHEALTRSSTPKRPTGSPLRRSRSGAHRTHQRLPSVKFDHGCRY